jgi:tetratricopeptide (TPR) repeat protein
MRHKGATGNGQWAQRAWLLLFLLLIAHCPLRPLYADAPLLQQAQTAWQNRDKPGETEHAITLWQKALKENPALTGILIDLTRACGRAYRHATTNRQKNDWADLARNYGAEAITKNPGSSEAYAQYGAALGQWAQAHKGFSSVKVVRQAIDMLRKAVELNPKNPVPHMLLAEMFRQAPHFITKAGKQDALLQARQAVRYGNAYALNHVVLAKALIDTGHEPEAIQELNLTLRLKAPADAVPETQSDKEDARAFLRSLGGQPSALAARESASADDPCNDRVDGICRDQSPTPVPQ